jgi:hypothetical protein
MIMALETATFPNDPRKFYTERIIKWNKKELRGFSPQANYTDQVTAACRRS